MPSSKELDPETGKMVTIVKSKKRVASDGTQRGLRRRSKTNKRDQLMEQCQTAVEELTGMKNWDPVVMMAMIAAQSLTGYPAVDDEGNPVLDPQTGRQLMVPPDRAIALAAAAKVAPYLHSNMKPMEVPPDGEGATDPDDIRDRVLSAFENMGVKVERDE